MGSLILFTAIVVWVHMSLWFGIAYLKKRNDVADIAWGLGFVTLAVALYASYSDFGVKHGIGLAMVALWGVRLATHIAVRHASKPEDGRYVEMRKKWKFPVLQSYTNVFLAQGGFMMLVAAPIMIFYYESAPAWHWVNFLGLAIWVIGMFFESVGDYQLARFIKNPKNKGKIMRYGLWKFTRHPNYFGEISLWWGFWLFTLFAPNWPYGVIGPITITFLLIGVSGIPMLERRYKGNKEYEKYQKSTSAFFPLPKK